jgi:predicted flap endonuclease-1-like 5' DNA nuclease
MKEKHSFNFMIGLLIGGLMGLLFWYWQKSTSAEDGALTLLDKLAATERRVRQLKLEMKSGAQEPAALRNIVLPSTATGLPTFLSESDMPEPDDLTQIKGIGAVFNGRLQQAGIDSFVKLKAISPTNLADILHIRIGRAENILAEAADH